MGSDRATWNFGLISTEYLLFALIGSLLSTLLLERTKITTYLFLFLLRLTTAGFIVLMAAQSSAVGFAVFYLIMFSWNGMANPPEGTVLNLQIPAEQRASLLSVASLLVQLGGLAGALVFGVLAGRLSIPAMWGAAAGGFGASSALYLRAGGWGAKKTES